MKLRPIFVFFALCSLTVALSAADMPKNLLRYNIGALPMTQSSNGTWVSVKADSIDWNAPYSSILSGDIGKNTDIGANKLFVIDLGQIEQVNRFSLFSRTATGSVTVYSSPTFEDPTTGKWSELGTLKLSPENTSNLTAAPADARYLKFVFSPDSQGFLGTAGVFGDLTYGDFRPSQVLQSPSTSQSTFSMNYATPITSLKVLSVDNGFKPEDTFAMFVDDPKNFFVINDPTHVLIDLGSTRQISSLYLSCSGDGSASVKLSENQEDIASKPTIPLVNNSPVSLTKPVSVRYAEITLLPGSPLNVNSLSFIGSVNPQSFVYERLPDVSTPANVTAGNFNANGLPPVNPITPLSVSQ
jgi:hypothetical protein